MSEALRRAERVLDEAAKSGLALERLPGNSAKLRLLLDLRRLIPDEGRIRVLDVGCTGLYHPFELWEPLLPLADRIELVGVDVANFEPTRRRAEELGFPFDLSYGNALELTRAFGPEQFDAVVSTQLLEHVRAWPDAVREMRDVLRPGGRLFVTCDSGDYARPLHERGWLATKRASARLGGRVTPLGRGIRRLVSGEWELGPTREELRRAAGALRLEIERLAWYGLRDLKTNQAAAGSAARLLWLAFEEALEDEAGGVARRDLYQLLYLRALKPARR